MPPNPKKEPKKARKGDPGSTPVGRGMAGVAYKAVKKANKTRQSRLDQIMGQFKKSRKKSK